MVMRTVETGEQGWVVSCDECGRKVVVDWTKGTMTVLVTGDVTEQHTWSSHPDVSFGGQHDAP